MNELLNRKTELEKLKINTYSTNREIQSIQSQILEAKLLEYLSRKPNIKSIYYINEYNNRSYKNIEQYLQNELNKVGVDIVIETDKAYYNCDMKCMRYSRHMGENPITVVNTIPIQVLNYNNKAGWGVNEYKISDYILIYIENKCYIKINQVELVKWLKPRLNEYKWIQCKKGMSRYGDIISEYIVNVKLEDILHFCIVEDMRMYRA